MVGITAYGAYIPYNRLNRQHIQNAFGGSVPKGEKAVANYDEDSLTMGAAAALDCARHLDPKSIDGLYFATTTSPYREKQAATTIAGVLDLRREVRSADFTDSLRAGSTALLAGLDMAARGGQVLVVASDCRLGAAAGPYENTFGDGAAALLVGSEQVIAEVLGDYSVAVDFHDLWRSEDDRFVRSWEERFCISQGYNDFVTRAARGAMEKTGLLPADFAKIVLYGISPRHQTAAARKLGFNPAQIQDSLFDMVGNTGAASALMMLVAALEEAVPGDRILLVTYGEGSDAVVLQVTEEITKLPPRRGIKGHLHNKKASMNYEKYLRWRELIVTEPAKRPVQKRSSLPDLFRNYKKNLGFYGCLCTACGTPQFPPSRICVQCQAVDQMEDYRFYGKTAKIATYTVDYLAESLDPPTVVVVVDFDGGGRMFCYLVDCDPDAVEVGMEVEMSFRRLFVVDGIHTYFWKATPKIL
jgi:3-hydroxy-3-methylglutaryl CoA synthase